jgi:hypothetical protein
MGFLRSSARFIWRVIRRSIAAVVLLLLFRVAEIYSKLIAPELPKSIRDFIEPYLGLADELALYLAFGIVIIAILYTFYEVDREVTRNRKIRKKLKEFYSRSGEMLQRKIASDSECDQFVQEAIALVRETREWIKTNMEPASLRRYEDTRMRLPYQHPSPWNDQHQTFLNNISIYHENLQALIENDAWR